MRIKSPVRAPPQLQPLVDPQRSPMTQATTSTSSGWANSSSQKVAPEMCSAIQPPSLGEEADQSKRHHLRVPPHQLGCSEGQVVGCGPQSGERTPQQKHEEGASEKVWGERKSQRPSGGADPISHDASALGKKDRRSSSIKQHLYSNQCCCSCNAEEDNPTNLPSAEESDIHVCKGKQASRSDARTGN